MAKLTWSPQAIADLESICDYIARDSEYYAKLFGQRLIAAVEAIPGQPYIGAVVPEYGMEDLRERRLQNYRIIYRVRDEAIEVVTLFHAARQLPPNLSTD
ncbi:MAG TPA: type II toxin-antitoxin system RelE/ParE family toxin [Pirellulales bacterium]|nr:type II toxin-antitoxin system RelE/ParE family toxin [Pirellulales bacterium]